MRKIHFTNKALQDLEEIWNYSYNFWNEEQADKYYRLLVKSIILKCLKVCGE